MGFAFAFGGVYLNAVTGSKVEAKPATAEPEDPVALLQRALLNDPASMAAARKRLRRLLGEAPPAPTQADAFDRHVNAGALATRTNGTYRDQRNVRRLTPPRPGAPGR